MAAAYANLVFPIPIDHAFTYRVPEELRESLRVGMRALAPFGRRRMTGFVVQLLEDTDLTEVKEIADILDTEPLFSEEMMRLCRWIADYYICPLGEVLRAALPAGIHQESQRVVTLQGSVDPAVLTQLERRAPRQALVLRALMAKSPLTTAQLERKAGVRGVACSLAQLQAQGLVRVEEVLPKAAVGVRTERWVALAEGRSPEEWEGLIGEVATRAPRQAECLRVLLASEGHQTSLGDLVRAARTTSQSLSALCKAGLVKVVRREVSRDYYDRVPIPEAKQVQLTQEQQQALAAIKQGLAAGSFTALLLHGVTGSGKTQVYIEAIREVLAMGKSAVVLVPEIALTPQIVARFRAHFREQVTVLHSRLSAGERFDAWRRIRQGAHRIVIGPRSAVFAPVQNLGLVVVDEEQESTFKQMDTDPRYHARDVAVMRAKLNQAVVVLGSATPSFETFFNAQAGKYGMVTLTHRIDHVPMPEVTIVDMTAERRETGSRQPVVFSRLLQQKIAEKLSLGEQVILLQNRRGYATFIKCRDCGHVEQCRNCNVTLTFHLHDHTLRCHYCSFTRRAPTVCPNCGGNDILFKGTGTQKVEEVLAHLFPQARVVRMDLDTTRGRRAHDRILESFERGEFDILLGTQMVAKGLDFQRVTLVGVISADTGLFFPDFRAAEQTFQLLTQVAGRAGRVDKRGEVVIQSYSPDHYCLRFAQQHDFVGFYAKEIGDRRHLDYPPFGRLAVVCFKSLREEKAARAAKDFVSLLPKEGMPFRCFGPLPAPLVRLQRHYRWQVVLKEAKSKDPGGRTMNAVLRQALERYHRGHRDQSVSVSVDVDPVWMM
ncbi:MAG: primosomal protein N' [candidate division KSB1 bacterium]|nr:primosomal protein N' [candidate division KSB1 bacterium]